MGRLRRAEFTLVELQRLNEAHLKMLSEQADLIEELDRRLDAIETENVATKARIKKNLGWANKRIEQQGYLKTLKVTTDDETDQ